MSSQEKTRRRRRIRPDSPVVRWVVVLASVIGGVAAAIPLGQAAAEWWGDRTAGVTTQTVDGRTTVAQGSEAADALVRRLFDAVDGGRVSLDTVLVATPSQAKGQATNGFTVFYNCDDGPDEPGGDRCSTAKLFWESNPLPFEVDNGAGWHLVGTYSVALDANKGQMYGATIVAFALKSVTG